MFGPILGRASVFAFVASSSRRLGVRQFSPTTSLGATKHILTYDYIPDVLEKRGPYREGHIGLARELCLSGGPIGAPGMEVPTGALFVFKDEESAKLFVEKDPYVSAGIVTGHNIQEWNVVVEN